MSKPEFDAGGSGLRVVLTKDLPASVVVFLVALPLCLGIAIASGAPPASGLLTGIIGGLVVGFLSGSPLQVSGPAAGLSVVILDMHREYGPEALGIVVCLAGGLQLVSGLLRLGQWFRAVSPAVIQGMLAGIGLLIVASQFHVMVDDRPRENFIQNVLSVPESVWKGVVPLDGTSHHRAAVVGVLTLLVLAFWKSLAPCRLRLIPAPLAGVALGTAVAAFYAPGIQRVPLPDHLADAVRWPRWEWLGEVLVWKDLVADVVMVAVIASAETLLCAAAVDQMHNGPRTRYDRELAAQGVGNMLCGLVGGLPMTGVIVRSSANIQAGARTRAAAVCHGAWLLLCVLLFPSVLRLVPTASLAAVLVFTGYKLVSPHAVRVLWQYGKSEVLIYAVTAGVIVLEDLLTGVLVGFILSVVKLVFTFTHLGIRTHVEPTNGRTTVVLKGSATFLRLPKLASALESVPPRMEVHLNMEELSYIDHACVDLVTSWERQYSATGGRPVVDWDGLSRKNHPDRRKSEPLPAEHREGRNAVAVHSY